MSRPAVILLGPSAIELGRHIADAVGGELHGYGPRIGEGVVTFTATAEHLRTSICRRPADYRHLRRGYSDPRASAAGHRQT